MAKSIWKPGERMTRLEKKKLRRLLPHPNRGRALYQWKAEQAAFETALVTLDNNIRGTPVNWAAIVDKPEQSTPVDSATAEMLNSPRPEYTPKNQCPRVNYDGIRDDEQADDLTYALEASIDNAVAQRPGEPITEQEKTAVKKLLSSATERLDLPPGTNLHDLYLE